jgi:predicted membrane protein
MSTQDTPSKSSKTSNRFFSNQQLFGLFFVLIGVGYLLRRLNVGIPEWLFGWETILILIGLYQGISSGFRDISWAILIIIGMVFLIDDIMPDISVRRYIWPIGLIVAGLVIMTKGSLFTRREKREEQSSPEGFGGANTGSSGEITLYTETTDTQDDWLEATAIFGGVKRSIVSKHFKGGEVTSIMGGSEINLAHADIQGITKLEIVNIMGGTKLIVPAHWDVQSRMVAILGGVDDKRNIRPELIDPNRRLIIEGTSLMGGLEIRSF